MARQALGAVTFPFGIAVGTGVGSAIAGVVEPTVQDLKNAAWRNYPVLPLEAVEAAQLVASGERPLSWGQDEAQNVGINLDRFNALVDVFDTAPDLSLLFTAWRRGIIDAGEFRAGAKKHGIEDEWIDVLAQLRQVPLSAAESAAAWQQGYMPEGDSADEAALSGVNATRSQIQRELAGLPPGPETALAMLRRGIIDAGEFEQMIREGNTKTKYTDEYLELRAKILGGPEWAGLWLRGWATEAEAKAGGALDGYDAAAMDNLYLNRGRPATTRQVHIGWQRGGRLPGTSNEREAFERSVRQSNIRTEYVDLLWAQRFTYPSAFVIRALASDGTFDRDTTERILIESGWNPDYATLAADKWAGAPSAGPGTKWADRQRSRLFSALHSDYVDGGGDEGVLRDGLATIAVAGAEQNAVVSMMEWERQNTRRDLTQAQILKLFKKAIWTREQAQLALDDLGMDVGDASDLLDAV